MEKNSDLEAVALNLKKRARSLVWTGVQPERFKPQVAPTPLRVFYNSVDGVRVPLCVAVFATCVKPPAAIS